MTFPCYYPQNEKFVEEQGKNYATSAETTLSNGAYKLTAWEKGSKATFEKNNDYYNADAVKLEELNMLLVLRSKTCSHEL